MTDIFRDDPYRRRISTPPALDRLVALGAIIWGGTYLGWRATDSLFGVPLVLGVPLLLAEVLVWISFGSLFHRMWRRPREAGTSDPAELGSFDIFVTSLNDPVDAVRATLIGCHALDTPHTLWVLDDGHRADIASLATEHGAEYVARTGSDGARAGNINHAMALTEADFVLLLNAGEVPMPDLLAYLAPAFSDDRIAVAVAGVAERDADRAAPRLVEHAGREIIGPSLDSVDAAVWDGGPVLVRHRAHVEVGGLPTDTVTPDVGFSLRLWRHGWTLRLVPVALAEVPGPANLTARLSLRDRHALGRIEGLRRSPSALSSPGLSLHQRAGRVGVLATAAASAGRLVMVGVAISVLLTGVLPLSIGPVEILALWLPALALRALATWTLSDGVLRPFAVTQHDLAFIGLHTRALGHFISGRKADYRFAPRHGRDPQPVEMLAKVPLLAASSLMLFGAIVFRVNLSIVGDDTLSTSATLGLLAASGLGFALMAGETARWAHRGERRTYGRLPVEVGARIDGTIVRVLDVVGDGIGVETGEPLRLDSMVRVSLHLPDPTGALHDLRLTGRVRWVSDAGDGVYRGGLEFEGLRPIERDRLVEFASVTVPYRRVARPLAATG